MVVVADNGRLKDLLKIVLFFLAFFITVIKYDKKIANCECKCVVLSDVAYAACGVIRICWFHAAVCVFETNINRGHYIFTFCFVKLQRVHRTDWIWFNLITGYQVEKRRPGGSWEKANLAPILGENATISDLDEGEEYEFRVAAITNAGVGDYSLNTMPVKVCERKRQYFI